MLIILITLASDKTTLQKVPHMQNVLLEAELKQINWLKGHFLGQIIKFPGAQEHLAGG